MSKGQIYDSKTMFFREVVGTAQGEDGRSYEMTTNVGDGSPLVCSSKTGKYFRLSWQDILSLAVEAGIDEPEPAQPPTRRRR